MQHHGQPPEAADRPPEPGPHADVPAPPGTPALSGPSAQPAQAQPSHAHGVQAQPVQAQPLRAHGAQSAPPDRHVPSDPPGALALRPSSRVFLAVAAAVVAAAVVVHLGMVFLHVAPSNTVSKQHASTIDAYVYPEFEQNWKLFAPNPLQQNIAVHARAELPAAEGGGTRTTAWVDLTAIDAAHIRGNPFPSHISQNELRRAWDFFNNSHDSDNRPTGRRGELSEAYLKRIVMLRLGDRVDVDEVSRIQVRSATSAVAPPPWSGESVDTRTKYRVLPWWPVTGDDIPGDAR
ncbi:DUF5819 family protein [Streptomyces sp. 549]|uniref:DUF5819 family protein n=1 Tax=Streptomyces sp. 549 TaxID=3049076 RepID=UPI0024C2FBF0|nr:DUF5819 family protein [Streptomyces sp. 549]MDK1473232.1 DUF5819 family protein [Streptomyces sp. 549]